MIYGADYFKHVNEAVLVLGMVETPGAIANLDEILELETMDGIYVGPNDLGIAMGMAAGTDREEPEFVRAEGDRCTNARWAGPFRCPVVAKRNFPDRPRP